MKTKIKFKSKLARYKNLAQRNKAFDKLSNEDKRKEIAWDGLQMVLKKMVCALGGTYWSSELKRVSGDEHTFQSVLNQKKFYKENNCMVCQRGLLMLSQIRLGNSISSYDGYRCDGNTDNIKGFSISSFMKMEDEFENGKYKMPHAEGSNEKLANICCNIIVNGNFNTKDKTDYLK